jgi:hypothetical protein
MLRGFQTCFPFDFAIHRKNSSIYLALPISRYRVCSSTRHSDAVFAREAQDPAVMPARSARLTWSVRRDRGFRSVGEDE